jgi:thioredoxin-related protein
MQKVKWFFVITVLFLSNVSFLHPEKEKIKWLSFDELSIAYKKEARPIIFDVYTDWCGWCKVMDKETYSKEKVASYINSHYYAVKFNAESTAPVVFNGKKYGYNASNRSSELANYLLFGQYSFPTTVFLSSIDARPAPLAGFLKPAELEAPLKYFGDGAYKKQNYDEFMKSFKPSW